MIKLFLGPLYFIPLFAVKIACVANVTTIRLTACVAVTSSKHEDDMPAARHEYRFTLALGVGNVATRQETVGFHPPQRREKCFQWYLNG